MSWQEKYSMYLFHSYFGQLHFNDTWFSNTPKLIPSIWESKSISRTMCSQKCGDLYVISYLYFNLDILHVYATPILHTLISTPFQNNTSGKYITPPISLYQIFWKLLSYELRYSLKHHLVIIECDHFYKIVLLIMEMVVWLILVVWFVWS